MPKSKQRNIVNGVNYAKLLSQLNQQERLVLGVLLLLLVIGAVVQGCRAAKQTALPADKHLTTSHAGS